MPLRPAGFQESALVRILVTNDDGIDSEGLDALIKSFQLLGEVFVVAPDRQRSGVGMSITIDRPLRIDRRQENVFIIDGMPVDCVMLAIHKLMPSPPDLIVSGVNDGQNIGYDVYHSGTVGAAIMGTMLGVPSMAVSIANRIFDSHTDEVWYESAAKMALKLAGFMFKHDLPEGTLLNVNVPNLPMSRIKGIEVTKHCDTTYDIEVKPRTDPRGRKYYWLGGGFRNKKDDSKTDRDALRHRKVSVTPLQIDMTNYRLMEELSSWVKDATR